MTEQSQHEVSLTGNEEVPTKAECLATKEPAVRAFIVSGMAIGAGIYCGVDHFIRGRYQYPVPYELGAYIGYLFNHYGAFVFTLAGIVALVWAVMFRRRKLVADDEGIGYVGKKKIPWSAVSSLDSSKLADKGIIRLHYETDGSEGILTLDSWKLQDFRSLVQIVEKKAPSGS